MVYQIENFAVKCIRETNELLIIYHRVHIRENFKKAPHLGSMNSSEMSCVVKLHNKP